ncbi:MAG TPA: DUF5671 domain-containing protein [Anaerolineales bacterium]|nr:DUF5671 domain-containing protein [Anaerolineales bacterium]
METVRRWYLYCVNGITLNGVIWAVITLLWDLLVQKSPIANASFQIAVVIILLPVYLVHWLWAQRLASKAESERASFERRFYLYVMLSAALGPLIHSSYNLLASALTQVRFRTEGVESIITLLILAVFWLYHWQVLRQDQHSVRESEQNASVRRFYWHAFSFVGLGMLTTGSWALLTQIFLELGLDSHASIFSRSSLLSAIAGSVVGLVVWVGFWMPLQNRFHSQQADEQESLIRKFYLYLIVFIAVLTTLSTATLILSGFLRTALKLQTDGQLSPLVAALLSFGCIWAYHAWVLWQDSKVAVAVPQQLAIRRLYLYLLAWIGLLASVLSLLVIVEVLIRAISANFWANDSLRSQLAWTAALLAVALPLWLLSWRPNQNSALLDGERGRDERRSVIRKAYLYFFLFIAVLLGMGGLVYLVYQGINRILGGEVDIDFRQNAARALAYIVMGVLLWLAHWFILQMDWKKHAMEQTARLKGLTALLVGWGENPLGAQLHTLLQRELPQTAWQVVHQADEANLAQIAQAGLLVAPASLFTQPEAALLSAVQHSPAHKVIVPANSLGWQWVGQASSKPASVLNHTLATIRAWANDDEARPSHPLSYVGWGLLAVILLVTLVSIVATIFDGTF